jgi:hypothetical protein
MAAELRSWQEEVATASIRPLLRERIVHLHTAFFPAECCMIGTKGGGLRLVDTAGCGFAMSKIAMKKEI